MLLKNVVSGIIAISLIPVAAVNISAAESEIPDIRIADTEYNTNEYIVAEYYVTDFGAEADGRTDCTESFQAALNAADNLGGGTVYVPSGEYALYGSLTIPTGTVLAGDWKEPSDGDISAGGTLLKVYAAAGEEDGEPLITINPNAKLQGMNIWYPEQKIDDVQVYPPTVRMYNPKVWGADAAEVKNVTFVNSYKAIQQGPAMSGCPNVTNIYGTPLGCGMDMDGIADVGRFTNIHFSPKYWSESGLQNSPSEDVLRTYTYENASAVVLARIDWSYFTSAYIDGYKHGVEFRYSTCSDSYKDGELASYVYPNGQCYDINISDCETGLYSQGCSGAGELIYDLNIANCRRGIEIVQSPNTAAGNLRIMQSSICGDEYAVRSGGEGKLYIENSEIDGDVYADRGFFSLYSSNLSDCDNLTLERGISQAAISGNTNQPDINNAAGCYIAEEESETKSEKAKKPNRLYDEEKKPSERNIFVVTNSPYNAPYEKTNRNEYQSAGSEDAGKAIQRAINDAKAAGGGIVYCPAGRYRILSQIIVPDGVELRGATDRARIPIKTGTIFDVGRESNDTEIPVILNQGSGIRAIVFNQPGQTYDGNPIEHPYVIQGRGSDIYAINISLRNVYNGLDFSTYRCDRHYIDGIAGIAYKNEISVGGGCSDGVVKNSQFNWNSLYNGSESKYGCWEDSPPNGTTAQYNPLLKNNLAQNLDCIIAGDSTNELLFNNFSIFGSKGLYLKDEGNGGFDGTIIGHGVDGSRLGVYMDGRNEISLINTQLVSFEYDDSAHITAADNFSGKAHFENISSWSTPAVNIDARNGEVWLDSFVFNTVSKNKLINSDGGNVRLTNGYIRNTSPIADKNEDRIEMQNVLFENLIYDGTVYKSFENCVNLMGRYTSAKPGYPIDDNDIVMLSESFDDFPVSEKNGVENAADSGTRTFGEIGGASDESNVSVSDGWMKLYLKAPKNQVHIYNHSLMMPVGESNSKYRIEVKFKLNSMSSTGKTDFLLRSLTGANSGDAVPVAEIKNGKISLPYGTESADIQKGKTYIVCIDINAEDIENGSISAMLYDENGTAVNNLGEVSMPPRLKGGRPMGHLLIRTTQSSDASGVCDIDFDEIFVSRKAEEKWKEEIIPELGIDDNSLSGSVKVNAITQNGMTAVLAVYDESGRVVYTEIQPIYSDGLSEFEFNNIFVKSDSRSYTVKFMQWNGISSMQPSGNIMEKKVQRKSGPNYNKT